jgi:hypothetical protein
MELEEQQIVVKWRSLSELKEKLRSILGELESSTESKKVTYSPPTMTSEAVPDEVRKLGLSAFSAAMLAVLRESHRGKPNAIAATDLAREMKHRYPLLLGKKDPAQIAHGTIFPGKKMADSGLIQMDKVEYDDYPGQYYRIYWSDQS